MARSSTRSRRTPRRHRPTFWERAASAGEMLRGDAGGWCVLASSAIVAVLLASWMDQRTHAQAPAPSEVRFLNTPDWVGDSLLEHVGRMAARQCDSGLAPTQGDLLAMHDALNRSGWFEQVSTVRRTPAGDIEVEATFLTPATTIRDSYGEVVIDRAGRPLPDGTRMDASQASMVLINPRHDRPTRPLSAWRGDDVAAALRLHALLIGHDWSNQIRHIDLAEFDRTGTLTLETDLPSRIRWGSPPGEETPLETLAARKIHRMEASFRSHGRVDQHHAGEVDLTIASHLVHR